MRNRIFSLLVPWFMDGSVALAQTAMPLLAVRLGANAIMLGTISWVAQVVRTPICLASGGLSERFGRKTLIVPAALTAACGYVLYTRATKPQHVLLLYAVTMASIGAFYPSLQALIGDVSKPGELRKNLGAFNIGWCVGAGITALAAGAFIKFCGLSGVFYIAAAHAVTACGLVVAWKNDTDLPPEDESIQNSVENAGPLLLIARLGMFTAFFGYATTRILFPKMAITTLNWSEQAVAWTVAGIPMGQAAGMIATTATPWWRGKLWPQVGAQSVLAVCALATAKAYTPVFVAAAFFGIGFALSTAYTAALYHGLSSRRDRGRNTGIHESLVASGGIAGSLIGGIVAQEISPRAPYWALCGMAAASMLVSIILWRKRCVQ